MEIVVCEEYEIIYAEKLKTKHVDHGFATDTFLGPGCTGHGFLKINNVSFDVEVNQRYRPAQFKLTKFVQLVVREIPSEKTNNFIAPKVSD